MADILISDLPVITSVTGDDFVVINDGNVTTSSISFANLLASITQVGIVGFADGTEANPAVTFSNDINTGIYRPGPDTWAVSTNGNQRFVINKVGQVAVGNEDPSPYGTSLGALVVGDTTSGDNGVTIVSSPTDIGAITWADGTSGGTLVEGQIAYDHNSNHLEFSTSGTEALRITTNQEFLVGTTVPIVGSKVVIDGGAISIPTGSSGVPSLNFATDTDTGVWSAAADHVSVATGGVERLTVDDNGHFYLAADSDTYFWHPAANTLAVSNQGVETARFTPDNNVQLSGATPTVFTEQNELRLSVDSNNDTGNSALTFYVDGGEFGRVSATGFGIGVTAPQALLHLNNTPVTGYAGIYLQTNNNEATTSDIALTGNAVVRADTEINSVVGDGGSFSWSIGGTTLTAGLFGATEQMTLDGTGLGIGTTSPEQALDVNGNIVLTGAGASGPMFSTPVANTVAITTDGTEAVRVNGDNAIGLGGANYGSPGQVLTSQGSAATPTWTTPTSQLYDISQLSDLP